MRFERRNIVIRTMEPIDVENYYFQYLQLTKAERKEKIKMMREKLSEIPNDITSKVIFVVEEKDSKKIVGTIYGVRKCGTEEISISIPNEIKLIKYGAEIIDQFLKICKEKWWPEIKFIKLNKDNKAAEIYMKERELDSEYISVA